MMCLLSKETLLYEDKNFLITHKKHLVMSKKGKVCSGVEIKVNNISNKQRPFSMLIASNELPKPIMSNQKKPDNLQKDEFIKYKTLITKSNIADGGVDYCLQPNSSPIWIKGPVTALDFVRFESVDQRRFQQEWKDFDIDSRSKKIVMKKAPLDRQIINSDIEFRYYFPEAVYLSPIPQELGLKMLHPELKYTTLYKFSVQGSGLEALMMTGGDVLKEAERVLKSIFMLLTQPRNQVMMSETTSGY